MVSLLVGRSSLLPDANSGGEAFHSGWVDWCPGRRRPGDRYLANVQLLMGNAPAPEAEMARLAQTPGLTDVQRSILETVREFADKEIIPQAQRLEHADEYPTGILDGMREMGLFGLTIAEEYGGLG